MTDESPNRAVIDESFGSQDTGDEAFHTGHPAVDEAVAGLDVLADLPVAEHVAVLEGTHERLRAVLDGPRLPRP